MISGFPLQQGSTFCKEKHFVTLQKAGIDKYGIDVLPKSAHEIIQGNISAVSYNSITRIWTITLAAHLAKPHDFIRFLSGTEIGSETPIFSVPTANTIQLYGGNHLVDVQVGDTIQVLRWVTPTADATGGIAVSVPTAPAQFVRNGSNQQVIQDTAVPANNRPMPSSLHILMDGENVPVTKDTSVPGNTVPVPVELVAASGAPINIYTDGDVEMHTSSEGLNFDSQRIGDGTGNYVGVTANDEAKVHDADVKAELQTLNGVDFATEAKQDAAITILGGLSTVAKQNDILTALALLSTHAKQDSTEVLLGPVIETAPASDTASSGINGRLQRIAQRLTSQIALLPTSLGQKTGANSLAVVMASDFIPAAPAVPATLTLKNATVTAGLTAIRATTDGSAPSATRRKLRIFVDPDTVTSSAKFYLGASTVTISSGTKGEQIYPGAPVVFDNDANDYYIISDVAAQPVSIVEVE